MSGLNSFDKTDRKYSIAATDDLVRSWEVKVTAGHQGGESIHVDAGSSKYLLVTVISCGKMYMSHVLISLYSATVLRMKVLRKRQQIKNLSE